MAISYFGFISILKNLKSNSNFSQTLFFIFLISFCSCKSVSQAIKSEENTFQLREQIVFLVKSLNEGNEQGLKTVYADDYEGINPVTKFESKQTLVSQLVENQKKQQLKIEMEIIEIDAKSEMGFAVLKWKTISGFRTSKQQTLYQKKHLQIWIKKGEDWQLKRSLFYN